MIIEMYMIKISRKPENIEVGNKNLSITQESRDREDQIEEISCHILNN
jgi:hypothetical protein